MQLKETNHNPRTPRDYKVYREVHEFTTRWKRNHEKNNYSNNLFIKPILDRVPSSIIWLRSLPKLEEVKIMKKKTFILHQKRTWTYYEWSHYWESSMWSVQWESRIILVLFLRNNVEKYFVLNIFLFSIEIITFPLTLETKKLSKEQLNFIDSNCFWLSRGINFFPLLCLSLNSIYMPITFNSNVISIDGKKN